MKIGSLVNALQSGVKSKSVKALSVVGLVAASSSALALDLTSTLASLATVENDMAIVGVALIGLAAVGLGLRWIKGMLF